MPDVMRLPYLRFEDCSRHHAETLKQVSAFEPRNQSSWYSHAYALIRLAKLAYVIGRPFSETRANLRESVTAFHELFSRRGQTVYSHTPYKDDKPLPTVQLVEDGYSSVDSLNAALVCLITENTARARALVELAGQSPNAQYVSPQSEVCTSNQQTLSHALNAVLAQNYDAAWRETQKIAVRRGTALEKQTAATIGAIATNGDVRTELDAVLFQHGKLAKRQDNWTDASLYLCLPALGLASLAVQLGRLEYADLDGDNMYAPAALLLES